MIRRWPVLAALILACGLPARPDDAQAKTGQSIQYDIVVTATRLETPGKEIASSVTVITAQQLARTGKTNLLDVLQDIVGLAAIRNGGEGAASSVSIRGANTEHTLVLLDGVELNDPINPSRSYDLSHFTLSQVERIEVLRGPQSPLYGSDALGGVINIITKKGHGRPRLAMSGDAGSYRSVTGDVGLSGSAGKADYSLGLFYTRTAGISAASTSYPGNTEPDGYRNFSLTGRVGYTVSKNVDVDVMVRTVKDRSDIDAFGGPYGDDPNSVQKYVSTVVRAQARGLFLNNRWEQKLTISWVGSTRRNSNPTDDAHPFDSESAFYGSSLARLDWQNNFFLRPTNTLTAGAELAREQGRSDYTSNSQAGPYESSFPSERALAVGFYVQDQWKVRDRLFLTSGVRLDSHSRTGTAATFRLAPAYVIAETGTKIKATVGTGFKSPSLYQLFAPGTIWGPIGNLNLRPERAVGWDAGVEQDILSETFRLGVTYFANSFRNLIDFDFSAGYINVGRAATRGVEVSLESRVLASLLIRTSYTRLTARDEVSGAALLRRPRDKFAADIQSRIRDWLDMKLSVLYVGRRTDRDFSVFPAATVSLPGYFLLNGAFQVPLRRSVVITLRLDNVLNTHYETVWGYGSPGFTVNAGFRLAM